MFIYYNIWSYAFRIDNTRHICSLLQQHCNHLAETLKRSIDEKLVLKNVYDEQFKCIDELSQKFATLHDFHIPELEKMKSMRRCIFISMACKWA
jgi:hypothetical protein